MPSILPHGSWPSPITAAATLRGGIRFTDVLAVDGDDLYWVESRPEERGRSVLIRRDGSGTITEVGPWDFDVRTRVHEYGGGSFAVAGGVVFAAHCADQRWYRIQPGSEPLPITPEPEISCGLRYADAIIRDDWAIAVRERHPADGSEAISDLVRLDLTGATEPVSIVTGHDFFASPRISPDGTRLAWLTWDHPAMPWDGTELWMGDIDPSGVVTGRRRIAGGTAESILQPEWSPAGVLHVVSDRSGWWNLHRVEGSELVPIHPAAAEYGLPMWTLGDRRYGFLADGRIVAVAEAATGEHLEILDGTHPPHRIDLPHRSLGDTLAIRGATVYLVAAGFDRPSALIGLDLDTGRFAEVRASEGPGIDRRFVPQAETITFGTPDGPAHAWFYPPTHPDHTGPAGEAPPLVVTLHGGPTSRARMNLEPEVLFWTSRGMAVVDVDYGGSTGYGRLYRERLRGEWGVVDVRDCALAAAHLATTGRVDPARMLIRGGSAGGFTVLLALAGHDVFAGGMARYPVTDLEMLAADTHKFESRYLDWLIGPLPQERARYQERSPTNRCDGITTPVLLLQGAEDKVVPPSQPRAMREALIARGTPVAYLEFPGEGHGFRGAEARVRALEAELWFAGRVLGLTPADAIDAVPMAG